MSQFIPANPNVVAALLARFTFTDLPSLEAAANVLAGSIRLATQQTAAYAQIPTDSVLPPDAEVNELQIAQWVHPHNVAAALLSIANTGGFAAPADLQVYVVEWQVLANSDAPLSQLVIAPPPAPVAPPPPPVAVAPPLPPAPPTPPAPPAPPAAQDVTSLVAAAMGAPDVIDSTAVRVAPAAPQATITTPEQFAAYRAQQGHVAPITPAAPVAPAAPIVAPSTVAATPLPATPAAPQHVTLQQALAESADAEAVELPDPSVLAERRTDTGRPQKSPFERKVELRNKIADAPFWWPHLRYTAKRLFAENPATATDPSSTGAAPVQSFAVTVALAQELLRCAPADATVAQLRTYLREVETGICGQPSADAINQLVAHLFGDK